VWARVAAADFLTVNEKRAAVGYGPVEGGDGYDVRLGARSKACQSCLEERYNPHWELQQRVPCGNRD
jgi:hypothetical protein